MPFTLIQPDRFSEELQGIILKKSLIILSKEFLEIHALEKAFYADMGLDRQKKLIAIRFREESNSTSYKISYAKNLGYKVIRINKIISIFNIIPHLENRQVNFEYQKHYEGMEDVFLLDLSPFVDKESQND